MDRLEIQLLFYITYFRYHLDSINRDISRQQKWNTSTNVSLIGLQKGHFGSDQNISKNLTAKNTIASSPVSYQVIKNGYLSVKENI